ncbi:MAG TPA: DnaJ domain-containing protein [Rubricoccaceae bacterium]
MPVPTPHQILGVPPGATPDDVRRAFRRRAFVLHPDRNPSPTAADDFRALRAAYDAVLAGRPAADGFDVDQIARDIEAAAHEADRRRSSGVAAEPVWQQVRVPLDRSPRERLADGLATVRGRTAAGAGAGLGLAIGAAVLASVGMAGWGLSAAALAAVVCTALGLAAAWTADPRPWAVDTHWRGVRDLRWDATVEWDEICAVDEAEGWLDLLITDAAARRLGRSVPPQTLVRLRPVGAEAPVAYRLPLRASAPLAGVVRTQLATVLAA